MKTLQINTKDMIDFMSKHKTLYASGENYRFYVCIDPSEKVYYVIVDVFDGSEFEILKTYSRSDAIIQWNKVVK